MEYGGENIVYLDDVQVIPDEYIGAKADTDRRDNFSRYAAFMAGEPIQMKEEEA